MAAPNKNLPITKLTKNEVKKIKLIVFDVDGIIAPRGTIIKQDGNKLFIVIKKIESEIIRKIKELYKLGYQININSGRGLYMLQKMFEPILNNVSLTYENGSATWYKGRIYQHINSFFRLKHTFFLLSHIKNKNIKGFEPKEFIITIHCKKRVSEIEKLMKKQKNLYCTWNGEAYDIGIKKIQTKARGLDCVMKMLKLKKSNVLAIGDNYNDIQMAKNSGIFVTSDKSRISGKYFIPLNRKDLPAKRLIDTLITLSSHN